LLQEGKSDQEIVHYMVQRYGEFVLYRPPLDGRTALLWFAPALMLLIGVIVVVIIVRRQRNGLPASEQCDLAAEEQRALTALLESEKTNV
jgi:cytochrome c-type biogenesis protein CcmH